MNLKEFLDSKGMKKCHFAKKAKISRTTVLHALSGRDIRMSNIASIIDASDDAISFRELNEFRKKKQSSVRKKRLRVLSQKAPKRKVKHKKRKSETQENSSTQT